VVEVHPEPAGGFKVLGVFGGRSEEISRQVLGDQTPQIHEELRRHGTELESHLRFLPTLLR
jgi:hypothetical protein